MSRDATYGLRRVRVGEASNPGPRNLFVVLGWVPVIERATVGDPSNTMVGSSTPETHLLTDSDDTESVASSGFVRMFARDLEADLATPPPTWLDT